MTKASGSSECTSATWTTLFEGYTAAGDDGDDAAAVDGGVVAEGKHVSEEALDGFGEHVGLHDAAWQGNTSTRLHVYASTRLRVYASTRLHVHAHVHFIRRLVHSLESRLIRSSEEGLIRWIREGSLARVEAQSLE